MADDETKPPEGEEFASALGAEEPADDGDAGLGPAPPKPPSLMEMLESMSSAAKTTSSAVQVSEERTKTALQESRIWMPSSACS